MEYGCTWTDGWTAHHTTHDPFIQPSVPEPPFLPRATPHNNKHKQQGTFGPFSPNQRARVPLWLALTLKRQKKCRVVLPDWLDDGESPGSQSTGRWIHGWWWA